MARLLTIGDAFEIIYSIKFAQMGISTGLEKSE